MPLRYPEKPLVKAARFSRRDRGDLDEMITGLGVKDVGGREEALRELRLQYPQITGLTDDKIAPLVRLRLARRRLLETVGITEVDEMRLEKFINHEKAHKYKARVMGKVLSWLTDKVDDRIKDPCMHEIELIKTLKFIEGVGGLARYYETKGILTEPEQPKGRGIVDVGDEKEGVFGYNDYLGCDLLEVVEGRLRLQRQVNILDGGCGKAGAFKGLVEGLDDRLGGHSVVVEWGGKIVVFGGGQRLKLVGVSRDEYPHPDYVNYEVGDIEKVGLNQPFDEVWDVFGAFTYIGWKKKLLEDIYYPLLRIQDDGGAAGVARVVANRDDKIALSIVRGPEGVESVKQFFDTIPEAAYTTTSNGAEVITMRRIRPQLRLPIKERMIEMKTEKRGSLKTTYEWG